MTAVATRSAAVPPASPAVQHPTGEPERLFKKLAEDMLMENKALLEKYEERTVARVEQILKKYIAKNQEGPGMKQNTYCFINLIHLVRVCVVPQRHAPSIARRRRRRSARGISNLTPPPVKVCRF